MQYPGGAPGALYDYLMAMVVTTCAGIDGFVLGMLFMKTVIGTVPVGAFEGIVTLICQTPISQGAMPEY